MENYQKEISEKIKNFRKKVPAVKVAQKITRETNNL